MWTKHDWSRGKLCTANTFHICIKKVALVGRNVKREWSRWKYKNHIKGVRMFVCSRNTVNLSCLPWKFAWVLIHSTPQKYFGGVKSLVLVCMKWFLILSECDSGKQWWGDCLNGQWGPGLTANSKLLNCNDEDEFLRAQSKRNPW